MSDKGYIYLFNNNLCNLDKPYAVPMFREPTKPGDSLHTVWNYNCPINWQKMRKNSRPPITTGGNAWQLPDGSMFISSCTPFPYLYLVSARQQLIWGATTQVWSDNKRMWDDGQQYRASIVPSRAALENMIAHSSKH